LRKYYSLKDIRKDIREGIIDCSQLVDHYLKNIKEKAYLNAFLEVYEDEATVPGNQVNWLEW
jgi:aspartyl-tRNA(Asn)/glutamyl-tRNA(Gln) amidotransferase subunit A